MGIGAPTWRWDERIHEWGKLRIGD